MLAINSLLKDIQSIIIFVNTQEHKMKEIGNKNETIRNKDEWNYCSHFPILTLFGDNHSLKLLHMDKRLYLD